jgi:hypothetical protein
MIKTLKKLGTERMFLSIIMARYDKPIVNIMLNGEQLKPFPQVRNENFRFPSHSNKTRATNKRDSNRAGRSQTIPISR